MKRSWHWNHKSKQYKCNWSNRFKKRGASKNGTKLASLKNFTVTYAGMSLEAGNRQKSPVTLAVTAGYFFTLKKILRENLSSISNTTYSACIYWSACLRFQIFTNKHRYISSNPLFSAHRRWNRRQRGTELSGLHILGFFLVFFKNITMSSEWHFTKL